jgi:hypothetical protein
MYKILNNLAPNYLRDHFEMSTIDNFYRLRSRKLCLVLPKPQTEYLKKSFAFSGVKLWNTLREDVKCSNSLSKKSHHQLLAKIVYIFGFLVKQCYALKNFQIQILSLSL